ncbi:MAG: glutathione S-transferase family protein [Pseudomonadota bacterium]
MADHRLVIGNFNTSSWSLRAWLLMTHFGLPFEEVFVRLTTPDGDYVEGRREAILAVSESGFVPALKVGDATVWDTLAIAETLADLHPELSLWPNDLMVRAHARAVSAEMHSGFSALRGHHPMDLVRTHHVEELRDDVAGDVRRIAAIWSDCRACHASDGPFLFGAFSIADAMYAPVVSRFRTYGIAPESFGGTAAASAYMDAIWALPAMQAFAVRAEDELV